MYSRVLSFGLCCFLPTIAFAQPVQNVWESGPSFRVQAEPKDPAQPPKDDTAKDEKDKNTTSKDGDHSASDPKPYDKVITKDAKTQRGMYSVHQVNEHWYFEISKADMEKPLLLVTRIESGPATVDRGGFIQTVVTWERSDKRMLLREQRYDIVSSRGEDPVSSAVKQSSERPIILSFPIETFGSDDSVVIDVSKLFDADVAEFSVRGMIHGGSRDAARSFIDGIHVFPRNIEIRSVSTFNGSSQNPMNGGSSSTTLGVHYSLVLLPDTPMRPRLGDDRVGFFTEDAIDFGRNDGQVETQRFITRWNLKKKDPNAAVSDVVEPITYYIDPATPTQWIPYIRRAVENWNPAFEAAGFRNAIVVKDAPSAKENPDWSVEDIRYSVIRWLPSMTANAVGPHISDPRSGEILNAPVAVYQNVLKLVERWYFSQVGPLDARAQKLPFSDDLMGELLETVIEHEVGHSLGLMHNFKASSLYTIAQIRDPQWVQTMGYSPSIMDYARFNYVAQPEDHMTPADLMPRIGPYDRFAIHWGYASIPSAPTAEAEKSVLNTWALEQEQKPYLRFAPDGAMRGNDPGEEVEAVGDIDAVTATDLGIKNLERVARMILPATSGRPGEPYDDLKLMYDATGRQWITELGHVARIVGGANSVNRHEGQPGPLFAPVPRIRQKSAVQFLSKSAFTRPEFLLDPQILFRLESSGSLKRITSAEGGLLDYLISPEKIERLREWKTLGVEDAYSPEEFLADVRAGVWGEVFRPGSVKVDPFRQTLQHQYLDTVLRQLNTDVGFYYRGELSALGNQLRLAIPRAADQGTRDALQDSLYRITKAVDPKAGIVQMAPLPPPPAEPAHPESVGTSSWLASDEANQW